MKIGVMSDLHLGSRQYGLHEREEDFYKQYLTAIDTFIDHKVNVVIIAGDIFDKSRPSPRAIEMFVCGLKKLIDNNIDILNVVGNHAMIQSSEFVTADAMLTNMPGLEKFQLLDSEHFYYGNHVGIFGLPYYFGHGIEDFKKDVSHLNDMVEQVRHKDKHNKSNILVLHQEFAEYCGFTGAKLSINDIDIFNFDLIICGHIHNRVLADINNDTIFLQPGSLERMNLSEARDEEVSGKGIYIIDTTCMTTECIADSFYAIVSPRRFYIADMNMNDSSEIKDIKDEILDGIRGCTIPPVLFLTVHDKSQSFRELMDLTKDLRSQFLTVRFKYFDESQTEDMILDISEGLPTPRGALKMALNPLEKDEAKLGIDLFDALQQSESDISKILEDFRKKKYPEPKESTISNEEWLREMEEYFNE